MRYILIMFCVLSLAWLDPYKDVMNRGNGLYEKGKYPEADQAYMNAYDYLPSEKERPFVAFNRGDALFKAGDYEGAIKRFTESLDTDDPDLQKKSFFNMGNAYYQSGDKDKALESWMNALKIDPEYKKPRMNIEKLFQEEEEQQKQQKKNQKGKDQENSENKDNKKQDSDENNQNEQNNQNRQNQNTPSSHKKGEKIEQKLSDDQIDNLLQQFKKRPLQRKEGDTENGGRALEQDW